MVLVEPAWSRHSWLPLQAARATPEASVKGRTFRSGLDVIEISGT